MFFPSGLVLYSVANSGVQLLQRSCPLGGNREGQLTLDIQGMFVGAQHKNGIILRGLHNDCEAVTLHNDCGVLIAFVRTVASNLSIGNGSRAVSP